MTNMHIKAQENYMRAKDRLFALECDDSIHSENHAWWAEVKRARLDVQRYAAIVEQWKTNESSSL
tara:strand:+ start:2914 stop:3108 length:195 start_codon:yes stop_codon:yes gene_type:complete